MTKALSNPKKSDPAGELSAGLDIFEYSPIGMALVAPDGRWLKVNEALCKMVGYSEAELLTRTFFDITHPGDQKTGRENLRRQNAGEIQNFQTEKRYLHKDGQTITVLLSATLVGERRGEPGHFICQIQDITERKRTEEEMRWKTAFLQALVNSSLDGILVVDPKGKKIMQNPRLLDLLNIPESIANDQDDAKLLRWAVAQVKDQGKFIQKVTYLYAHPDEESGDEIELIDGTFLDRYSAPVIDADGVRYGRIWTFRDITQRKRAEESLRESEARYQRMAANVPGMVYQFTRRPDGTTALPFVSEGCREIYGLGQEQMQADPGLLLARVHPEDQAEYAQTLRTSAVALDPWNWQGRIIRAGREEICCVQAASRPELQANGDIRWDGVLVDITERKQAEENRRAREEAERSNREKSKFLSRVSHELRTPLNAILGFGQLLRHSNLQEQDAMAISYIVKGAHHLLSLVDEVLDLTRAEFGELLLVRREVDPLGIARECVGFVARLAAARGITCEVVEPPHQLVLWCDEQRLRQVVLNLLSNAIKYNVEHGAVTVSLELTSPDSLRLSIADTGEGISAEGLAQLFVPFQRLDRDEDEIEGTGLGLVVSRRIAEAMGGSVGVESEVGRGSKFWIELPLALPPEKLTSADCPGSKAPVEVSRVQKDIVLLYIEDKKSNVKVVEMLLARCRPDWRFLSTCDGSKGLEQAHLHLPDIIVLDLQLPGMMGEAVLRSLRIDPLTSSIPVIVLSADATLHSRERMLAQGAKAYVRKPFELDQLLETFDRVLKKSSNA